MAKLVRNFGRPVQTSVKELTHLFPRPEVLADADLSIAGVRGACASAIHALFQAVSKRAIRFEAAKTLEETLSRLRAVRGIGSLVMKMIPRGSEGTNSHSAYQIAGQGESDCLVERF